MDNAKLTNTLLMDIGKATELSMDDWLRVIEATCFAIEKGVSDDYEVLDRDLLFRTIAKGILSVLSSAFEERWDPAKAFAEIESIVKMNTDLIFKPKRKARTKKNEPKPTLH